MIISLIRFEKKDSLPEINSANLKSIELNWLKIFGEIKLTTECNLAAFL